MLVYDFTAGSISPIYFIQSNTNFLTTLPSPRTLANTSLDDDSATIDVIKLYIDGNEELDGVGDINAINVGNVIAGTSFGYNSLLDRVRLVAGGIRLFKTSKSENEAGAIRVAYTGVGELMAD